MYTRTKVFLSFDPTFFKSFNRNGPSYMKDFFTLCRVNYHLRDIKHEKNSFKGKLKSALIPLHP